MEPLLLEIKGRLNQRQEPRTQKHHVFRSCLSYLVFDEDRNAYIFFRHKVVILVRHCDGVVEIDNDFNVFKHLNHWRFTFLVHNTAVAFTAELAVTISRAYKASAG